MRLLLVSPSQKNVYGHAKASVYPPLGPLYVAAAAERAGHEVKFLDLAAEHLTDPRFLRRTMDFSPHAIGFTAATPLYPEAGRLASFLRRHLSIPLLLGGIHGTVCPEDALSEGLFDIVFIGEAEETITEVLPLLDGQATGKPDWDRLGDVRGIAYRQGDRPVRTPERPPCRELDTIPFPARHLLPDMRRYVPPDALRFPIITVMTSRGCPGRCTFCAAPGVFGRKVRMRSVENVVDEIEECIERFGIREVHIADDCFTINRERVRDFCAEIDHRRLRLNFMFMNGLRVDQVDREILLMLKETGFKNVGYGIESADPAILAHLRKDIDLERAEGVIRLSRELGFTTWVFFILGSPGETPDTIKKTLDFAKRVNPHYAKFFYLKPYPGTPLHDELRRKNLIHSDDYSDYGLYAPPVHHLPGLDPAQMQYWLRRCVREFYFRPRKVVEFMGNIRSFTRLRHNFRGFLFLLRLTRSAGR